MPRENLFRLKLSRIAEHNTADTTRLAGEWYNFESTTNTYHLSTTNTEPETPHTETHNVTTYLSPIQPHLPLHQPGTPPTAW